MYTVLVFDPLYKKEFSFNTSCNNSNSIINAIKRRKNEIIDGLKIYIGRAQITVLDPDFETRFSGYIENNIFAGHGEIVLKNA